jgi:hypothetical protein
MAFHGLQRKVRFDSSWEGHAMMCCVDRELRQVRRAARTHVSRRHTSVRARCGAISDVWRTCDLRPYATPLFPSEHWLQGLPPQLLWSHDRPPSIVSFLHN